MILEGTTLLVSGVGPGLGREIARCALRDGANVVLGARKADRLSAIARDLDPTGTRVAHGPLDITDESTCVSLVALAEERFGRLDAVAQVAAYDRLMGGYADTPDIEWARMFEVNVVGTIHLVKAAVPALERSGGGSVIIIGSQSSELPQMPQMAYGASKGALMTSMKYLARDLGPKKIRVNTVVPTWMWGPPVDRYVNYTAQTQSITTDEVKAGIAANMPLGEIPADDDVAEAVIFLASSRARMITGQALLINAGEHM